MSGSLVSLAGLLGLTGLLDVAGPFGIASLHIVLLVYYTLAGIFGLQ
jgi:hypothetical protein